MRTREEVLKIDRTAVKVASLKESDEKFFGFRTRQRKD